MSIDVNLIDKKRFEAFIDAVFAIVITFLVLEFKLPHNEHGNETLLKEQMAELLPLFVCYLLSFFTIMVIWFDHHHLFKFVTRITKPFAALNFLFLLPVSAIPFATGFAGENINSKFAVMFFLLTLVIMNIVFAILYIYAEKNNLIDPEEMSSFKFGAKISIFGLIIGIVSVFCVFIHQYHGFGLSFIVLLMHIYKIYMRPKEDTSTKV